jgi:hypothetical protein
MLKKLNEIKHLLKFTMTSTHKIRRIHKIRNSNNRQRNRKFEEKIDFLEVEILECPKCKSTLHLYEEGLVLPPKNYKAVDVKEKDSLKKELANVRKISKELSFCFNLLPKDFPEAMVIPKVTVSSPESFDTIKKLTENIAS